MLMLLQTSCQTLFFLYKNVNVNNKNPLVTVIALCYNHEKFVLDSLQSVVNQRYKKVELIVVDDFSKDKSREKILKFAENNSSVQLIFNQSNLGNCRSFNQALKIAKGKYIIDLSTDDVMLPNRITQQVQMFEADDKIGVVFSDCEYLDKDSKLLSQSKFNGLRKRTTLYPVGKVYAELLGMKLYINPPTMMVRKTLFDKLGGYDETLTYEDFDFWVRAARISEFGYVPDVLVQQRKLDGSHSTKFIQKRNILIPSKLKVCQKAFALNETEAANRALIIRLKSLLRQSVFTEHFDVAQEVIKMLKELNGENLESKILEIFIYFKIPTNFLYLRYNAFRRYLQFEI